MSSIDACLEGIALANRRILAQPLERRRRHIRERTVRVIVPDLATAIDMRLTVDGLTDIAPRPLDAPATAAQVRVTVSSDDLVDLAKDRLDPSKALFSRRLRVDASLSDLIRMKRVL